MGVHAFPRRVYTNDSNVAYWQDAVLADGSWTEKDDLSFIHKMTNPSTTVNELQTKAVASSTTDYNVDGGGTGTTKASRWYKAAYYDNGDPVLATDNFILHVLTDMTGCTAGTLRYFDWHIGVTQDPTSTNIGSINLNGAGIAWNFANTDADAFSSIVCGAVLSNGSPLSADDTHSYSTIPVIAGQCNVSNVSTDGAGTYKSWGCLKSATVAYTGGQLYLCVMAGLRGTARSTSLADETQFKIRYKFTKLVTGSL